MADNSINFKQNNYSGEVLDDLLTYASTDNDSYANGLYHVKSGIQYKYTLPSVELGSIIQDNVATPTSTQGKGSDSTGFNQYQFSERTLEPKDFMVYLEFNPRDFEKYYKAFQPHGNLVFRELNPKLQAKMLRLLMDRKNEWVGSAIWTSAKGGTSAAKVTEPSSSKKIGDGSEKYFDGWMLRMLRTLKTAATEEEKAGGKVILAGDTELADGAAVEKALNAMWKKCPKTIRSNKNLTFVMGWDAWDMYDQFLADKNVKYSDNTEVNKYRFKGKRIIPIVGVPEHTIVLGTFTNGTDSNLWMGVDYTNDTEVLKVDRLQNNSELYFMQMRMKMDVNIVRPKEIVIHTAYKNAD